MTQFNRTSENDGILQVFRREESPYETAVLKLKGLDADGTYLFADTDGGEFTVSGADLAAEGLNLTVTETRKAKIYLYKKV